MKKWSLPVWGVLIAAALGILPGCEGGGSSGDSGSSAIRGNVVSFQNSATAAIKMMENDPPMAAAANMSMGMGGPGGITVSLTGPTDVSAVTAGDGTFSCTNLSAGTYGLTCAFNGEEVMYRGNSGQVATITVQSNQTAELLNIRISGGKVNIGNVRMHTGMSAGMMQ
jgi:hypothetical protein